MPTTKVLLSGLVTDALANAAAARAMAAQLDPYSPHPPLEWQKLGMIVELLLDVQKDLK